MNALDLRKKTVKELNEELVALFKELFNMRTQRSIGQSKQTHHFKRVKRTIARIKTVICEKEGSV